VRQCRQASVYTDLLRHRRISPSATGQQEHTESTESAAEIYAAIHPGRATLQGTENRVRAAGRDTNSELNPQGTPQQGITTLLSVSTPSWHKTRMPSICNRLDITVCKRARQVTEAMGQCAAPSCSLPHEETVQRQPPPHRHTAMRCNSFKPQQPS
jgi:hypothetical protein